MQLATTVPFNQARASDTRARSTKARFCGLPTNVRPRAIASITNARMAPGGVLLNTDYGFGGLGSGLLRYDLD